MKILVLSDSHSGLSFMRLCVDTVRPDYIIHLGDYMDDGAAIAEEYPHVRVYQVPAIATVFAACSPSRKF